MDWATAFMERLGYVGIALIVLLENLLPPIPSEVVLPAAGFLTTSGSLSLAGVIIAATVGSVLGALALYWIGALVGRERIVRFVTRHQRWLTIGPQHVHKARSWFDTYGSRTVFLCRMVPILRSVISIPAGIARMRLLPFIIYTFFGSLIWNVVLAGLGALLGTSWQLVITWTSYYQNLVIVVGVVIAAIITFQWWRRRKS